MNYAAHYANWSAADLLQEVIRLSELHVRDREHIASLDSSIDVLKGAVRETDERNAELLATVREMGT